MKVALSTSRNNRILFSSTSAFTRLERLDLPKNEISRGTPRSQTPQRVSRPTPSAATSRRASADWKGLGKGKARLWRLVAHRAQIRGVFWPREPQMPPIRIDPLDHLKLDRPRLIIHTSPRKCSAHERSREAKATTAMAAP